MKKITDAAPGNGWAWAIDFNDGKGWVMCHWAKSSKKGLLAGNKPSPEARPVYVAIVPMRAYRARAKAKGG